MKKNLEFDILEGKKLLSTSMTTPYGGVSLVQPPVDPISDTIVYRSAITVTFSDGDTVIYPTRPVVPVFTPPPGVNFYPPP